MTWVLQVWQSGQKRLRVRGAPICTLSQNGYGACEVACGIEEAKHIKSVAFLLSALDFVTTSSGRLARAPLPCHRMPFESAVV